jgi:hypothetical protein
MKFFRYRRPSLSTVLGITKAKKRLNKELGITDVFSDSIRILGSAEGGLSGRGGD